MPFVLANVLQPLINVFEHVLLFFHDNVGLGWGFSIIALTITVRAALVPLTLKQFKGMQSMQRLAPEIKKLQEKYKDDKQRLNQEMMKLYQVHKVNPFASCLPLVAQMPVFISLFYMLRKDLKADICPGIVKAGVNLTTTTCQSITPGSGKFFFIPDLTDNATGAVLVFLIVLYIGSQLLSSVLMSVTADKNQRMIMIALPFVFTVFIINFPAGLLVYWITTNLWTVGQQYIVRRMAGDPVPLTTPPPGAGDAGGGGGLMGRLQRAAMSGRPDAGANGGAKPAAAPSKPARNGGPGDAKRAGSSTNGAVEDKPKATAKAGTPASGGSGASGGGAAPPPSARKKKKRSGRRR